VFLDLATDDIRLARFLLAQYTKTGKISKGPQKYQMTLKNDPKTYFKKFRSKAFQNIPTVIFFGIFLVFFSIF
jgi:hypothetical protein